jgi:hypothetical protein
MYVLEESDCAIVPMKPTNNEDKTSAEPAEGRAQTKENDAQPHTHPTQSGARVSQGLGGVRQKARASKQERLTTDSPKLQRERFGGARQQHLKHCARSALVGPWVDFDLPAMAINNLPGDPKTKAGANVLLGREKRFEDPIYVLRIDAWAIVFDQHMHIFPSGLSVQRNLTWIVP